VVRTDDVVLRRERVRRQVRLGKRVGYGLYTLACVLFAVGVAVRFTDWMTTAIIYMLVVGSLVLAPAIVFGYGIKSAERHERGETRRH
jgi:hypothetical protein